jgi:hypothetical protein
MASETKGYVTTVAPPPARSTEGVVVTVSSRYATAERFSATIWRPNKPLSNAHLMAGADTGVSQNGKSGHDYTGGGLHRLGAPPVRPRVIEWRPERFVTLAKWVGRVQEVDGESFVAVLRDQLNDVPEEEVELPCAEVSPADRPLLEPGAVFYWTIGYRDRLAGQRTRESVISFRRLPPLSRDDMLDAEDSARRLQALMDDE